MKEGTLMRVLFCKIHCPFICFCKPSSAHLYAPGSLKLENTPHVPSTALAAVSGASQVKQVVVDVNVNVNGKQEEEEAENVLKSCIRKLPREPEPDAAKEAGRKRVQWMDNLGKQLAEINEFESSETGDTDNEEESSRCLCTIL